TFVALRLYDAMPLCPYAATIVVYGDRAAVSADRAGDARPPGVPTYRNRHPPDRDDQGDQAPDRGRRRAGAFTRCQALSRGRWVKLLADRESEGVPGHRLQAGGRV